MIFEKNWDAFDGVFTQLPSLVPTSGVPDGPLFGNGDMGIAVGGQTDELTFWISKKDMWHASLARRQGHSIACAKGLGMLRFLSPALKNAAFHARQIIRSADVEIDLTTDAMHLRLTAYAPYTESLLIVQAEAVRGNIPLCVDLIPMADAWAEYTHTTSADTILITKDYTRNVEWDTCAAACCHLIGFDNQQPCLSQGQTITIAISVYTNHDTPHYLQRAREDVHTLTENRLADMRTAHLQWWSDFWNAAHISIPSEPEIEKFWYGSHYLMACCSKAGKFAPGLFGNWITTNHPNWNGDYHLNYNYQAPWWGVFSSNRVSLADPFDQPLMDYIPRAQENAQKLLHCRGLFSRVGIGPKGLESSRMFYPDGREAEMTPFWGQKSNASYAALNMLMRFYSTWDETYARSYAMPYLRETVAFWEDYLRFENDRYVIYNDCIHENSAEAVGVLPGMPEDIPDYRDDFNPILSLGLVRAVFRGALDVARYLDCDRDKWEKWTHILTHIADYPTQIREGKTVFRYTERGMDWCDGNSLGVQHIFPAGVIGLSSDPTLLQIARDTIQVMGRWSDYNAFPTFFTAAARVGYDPEIILSRFKEQFLHHSFPNLFIYYGGGGIECCSAVPGCVNEMLFQSHEGILRFFPVWEKTKNAAFRHLRGYGAFLASAALEDGVIKNVEILSEKGRLCQVFCPWDGGMQVLCDNVPVETSALPVTGGLAYTFSTCPNKVYRLLPV